MHKILDFVMDLAITIVAMLIIKRVFNLFSWDLSNPIVLGIIVAFVLNSIDRVRKTIAKKN